MDSAANRVLVVDDDGDFRALVASHLRASGFAVRAVAGGEEALATLAADTVDCIVLDDCMPGLDGVDVLVRLGPRRPPVVWLTYAPALRPAAVEALLPKAAALRLAEIVRGLIGARG